MAAHKDQASSVISSLQSEVSSEASPMLQFLIRHASVIVLGFFLFIAAIVGYWVYSWHSDKQNTADAKELGALVSIADPERRLAKLEEYLPSAPKSTRATAWFAVMESARALRNYPKLFTAWEAIGKLDPSLKTTAGLGMAAALASQDKYREALDTLDTLLPGLSESDAVLVNTQIVPYAEAIKDYARALKASEALAAAPDTAVDVTFWARKKADLERIVAEASKP